MPGPPPKKQRQRRQSPARGDWQELKPLAAPILPTMDERDLETDGVRWPVVTRMLWESWREDPVTATWGSADIALAIDTIHLHAANPIRYASEIRQRLDGLGLTPKGRQMARLIPPDGDVRPAA